MNQFQKTPRPPFRIQSIRKTANESRTCALLCCLVIFGLLATAPQASFAGQANKNQNDLREQQNAPPDSEIEADVSTQSIAITSGFSGTKIIVFGALNRPYKVAPLDQSHDVIVSVEGLPKPLVARRKSNVLGVWVNTSAMRFDNAPSYYAVAATQPLSKITTPDILKSHAIGIDQLEIHPHDASQENFSQEENRNYKEAVIRLKRAAKLYQTQNYGVRFKGRSLFRSEFELPANVPVGPLKASVYLFRDGQLVSRFTSRVDLHREGLQRYLFDLAYNHSFFYGVLAVIFAVVAGLSASAVFGRKTH